MPTENTELVAIGGILLFVEQEVPTQAAEDTITSLLLGWVVATKPGSAPDLDAITLNMAKVGWNVTTSDTIKTTSSLASLSDGLWPPTVVSDAQHAALGALDFDAAVGRAWWKASVVGRDDANAPPLALARVAQVGSVTTLYLAFAQARLLVPGLYLETPKTVDVQQSSQVLDLNAGLFADIRTQVEAKVASYRDLVVGR